MALAVFDPWIALAKEWQPLLAALLVVLASMIVAGAIIRAAKINAAKPVNIGKKLDLQDLRSAPAPAKIESATLDSITVNLEKLRSLLRSALSSLSDTNANDEVARSLCVKIVALPWQQFLFPADTDRRAREISVGLLQQFEMLQAVVGKECTSSEASAILIQLNANARALSAIIEQMKSDKIEARGQHGRS